MLQGMPGRRDIDNAATAFGIDPTQVDAAPELEQDLEVWPEHTATCRLFDAMRTQLRFAPGGVVGFDYAVLPTVAKLVRIVPRQLRQQFANLQVMEGELCRYYAEQANP